MIGHSREHASTLCTALGDVRLGCSCSAVETHSMELYTLFLSWSEGLMKFGDSPEAIHSGHTVSTVAVASRSSSHVSHVASHTLPYLPHTPPHTPPQSQPKPLQPPSQASPQTHIRPHPQLYAQTSPQTPPRPQLPYPEPQAQPQPLSYTDVQSPPPLQAAQAHPEPQRQTPTKVPPLTQPKPQAFVPTQAFSYTPTQTKVPPQTQPKPQYFVPNQPQVQTGPYGQAQAPEISFPGLLGPSEDLALTPEDPETMTSMSIKERKTTKGYSFCQSGSSVHASPVTIQKHPWTATSLSTVDGNAFHDVYACDTVGPAPTTMPRLALDHSRLLAMSTLASVQPHSQENTSQLIQVWAFPSRPLRLAMLKKSGEEDWKNRINKKQEVVQEVVSMSEKSSQIWQEQGFKKKEEKAVSEERTASSEQVWEPVFASTYSPPPFPSTQKPSQPVEPPAQRLGEEVDRQMSIEERKQMISTREEAWQSTGKGVANDSGQYTVAARMVKKGLAASSAVISPILSPVSAKLKGSIPAISKPQEEMEARAEMESDKKLDKLETFLGRLNSKVTGLQETTLTVTEKAVKEVMRLDDEIFSKFYLHMADIPRSITSRVPIEEDFDAIFGKQTPK
ncbi:hypothetical protein NFI96_000485 [Prochilodus magdalenae]|nr:hypothetical protein NFI96_000485 [Prochilodus magdalenae]